MPPSFITDLRILTGQFYLPFVIDLPEYLYKEKPGSAMILLPIWL